MAHPPFNLFVFFLGGVGPSIHLKIIWCSNCWNLEYQPFLRCHGLPTPLTIWLLFKRLMDEKMRKWWIKGRNCFKFNFRSLNLMKTNAMKIIQNYAYFVKGRFFNTIMMGIIFLSSSSTWWSFWGQDCWRNACLYCTGQKIDMQLQR